MAVLIGLMTQEKKKMKTISKTHPIDSKRNNASANRYGTMAARTFEPSSGGIGTRLKTARIILINVIFAAIVPNACRVARGIKVNTPRFATRIKRPKTIAMMRFESGPANPTSAGPHF